MRRVDFPQHSDDWHKWRKSLLTATSAPIIMGASPYCTPYLLYQRILGLVPEQKVSPAMMRGTHDEPIARGLFIEKYGVFMEPACIESEKYNFLGASLDGISSCGKFILEIKSNSSVTHESLSEGIPEHHYMQMQHQILCSDGSVEKGYYVSYNNGEIIVKEVFPDEAFFKKYLPIAKVFWREVIYMEPPKLSQKDYRDNSHLFSWESNSHLYKHWDNQEKIAADMKSKYKKTLIEIAEDENSIGCGIKLLKKTVKGRVDYDIIPELQSVDLEKFRKPFTNTWTIIIEN